MFSNNSNFYITTLNDMAQVVDSTDIETITPTPLSGKLVPSHGELLVLPKNFRRTRRKRSRESQRTTHQMGTEHLPPGFGTVRLAHASI
jgi:hypothetical protein